MKILFRSSAPATPTFFCPSTFCRVGTPPQRPATRVMSHRGSYTHRWSPPLLRPRGWVQPRGDGLRSSDPLVTVIRFPFFHSGGGQWFWRSQNFCCPGHNFSGQALIGLSSRMNRVTAPKGNDPVQSFFRSLITGNDPQGFSGVQNRHVFKLPHEQHISQVNCEIPKASAKVGSIRLLLGVGDVLRVVTAPRPKVARQWGYTNHFVVFADFENWL